MLYMVTFTINIPQMLAYIPYMIYIYIYMSLGFLLSTYQPVNIQSMTYNQPIYQHLQATKKLCYSIGKPLNMVMISMVCGVPPKHTMFPTAREGFRADNLRTPCVTSKV